MTSHPQRPSGTHRRHSRAATLSGAVFAAFGLLCIALYARPAASFVKTFAIQAISPADVLLPPTPAPGSAADQQLLARLAGHVRYFGFYADGFEIPTSGHTAASIIAESRGFTNTVWVSTSNLSWLGNVALAVSQHQMVILDVGYWFLPDGHLLDAPTYTANWKRGTAQLAPYLSSIVAFYPMDEPYTSADMNTPAAVTRRHDLETVNHLLKQTYPNIPLAVIFSAPSISPTLQIPRGYDWVGMDCYGNWESCGFNHRSMLWNLRTLEALLTPAQRFLLIPDASLLNTPHPSPSDLAQIADRIGHYTVYAANDPKVIGIFPFLLQSFTEGAARWTGARDMPPVLTRDKVIGNAILHGPSDPTP